MCTCTWRSHDRKHIGSDDDAKTFKSVAALLNWIAPDRSDTLLAIKEVLRGMARPGENDLQRLKRVLRFLKGIPWQALLYKWRAEGSEIVAFVDSDFAGCRSTRRSTCAGCIL